MPNRLLTGLAAILLVVPGIGAQAMGDESRLVVGVHAGFIGGDDLWSVARQPVYADATTFDEFRLDRSLRSNITVNGQLHYFASPNFGWTAELSYIGLGTRDRCTLLTEGVGLNEAACISIEGKNRPASAVTAMGGVIYRTNSRGDVQPYLRASVGFALVPRNTTSVSAFFANPDGELDFSIPIYQEDDSRAAKPTVAFGFGLATSPRNGYQFRFEARFQGVQLEVVDGPTDGTVYTPPVSSRWIFLPTLTLGMDIVLEKRRGRRY